MEYLHPHLRTDVYFKGFIEREWNADYVERHETHKKHKEDQEDSQLGLLLPIAVAASRVPEGLQDLQGDEDVADHNQHAG